MSHEAFQERREKAHDLVSVLREHPVATILAVCGGIAAAKLVFKFFAAAGDEAPIRVKNGTIDLTLESPCGTWFKTGNHWKTGGSRQHDSYVATVTANTTCAPNGRHAKLVITGSDGTVVTLDPTGNHTKVTCQTDQGRVSDDGQTLSFGSTDSYIVKIDFHQQGGSGGVHSCVFTSADLDNVYLTD
jgi:hypothetical protein